MGDDREIEREVWGRVRERECSKKRRKRNWGRYSKNIRKDEVKEIRQKERE